MQNSMMMFVALSMVFIALSAIGVNGQTEGAIVQRDPNSTCTICASETDTPNMDPTFAWFQGNTDMTCSDIQATVSTGALIQSDGQCKDYQLMAFQIGCCTMPPYEYCSVCPDGSDYVRSNEVPIGSADMANPTCAENVYRLASYIPQFTPGTCEDTVIQRGAFYCGCPNVEQQCYLCPDEQRPTNPERGDAWVFGSNCEGIEFLLSLYTTEECDGLRNDYGVDYAHFCKCPNYEKEDTGSCVLCDGGMANPNFVYTTEEDPFERTCQQAQDFAESITRENICIRLMEEVIAKGCNCNDGTGPVFRAEGQATTDAATSSLTNQVSVMAILALLVQGFLA